VIVALAVVCVVQSARVNNHDDNSDDEDSKGNNRGTGILNFFGGVIGGLGNFVRGVGNGIKKLIVGERRNDEPPVTERTTSATGSTSSLTTGTSATTTISTTEITITSLGSVFGPQKTELLKLEPFVTSGILDDRGNVVGSLTDGHGDISAISVKLVNHLEDGLSLSQVNALVNKKLCEQDNIVELSLYLNSPKYFLDKVKLMMEPSVQKFFEVLGENAKVDIQYVRRVFHEILTCSNPKFTIDNSTDKSGALILLDNVINVLENSLDQPRNLVQHLKRKLSFDEKLKTAAKFMNEDEIKLLQKEIVKSDSYQKILKSMKDDGKKISFLISSLLDFSSPLQTVILLF